MKCDLQQTSTDPGFIRLTESLNFLSSAFDVLDHYKVDQALFALGLGVDKKFRGRGIGTEILKARVPLMNALNLKVTSTLFTTLGGQKCAQAAGFELNYQIRFEDLQDKFPGMDFSHVFKTFCKVMSLKATGSVS